MLPSEELLAKGDGCPWQVATALSLQIGVAEAYPGKAARSLSIMTPSVSGVLKRDMVLPFKSRLNTEFKEGSFQFPSS